MTSHEASTSELTTAISTMHNAIVDTWLRPETPSSSLTDAQTVVDWAVEVRPGCEVTLIERHPGKYMPLSAPFAQYEQRSKRNVLPLEVTLPENRIGLFSLYVSNKETQLHDKLPDNPETLSYRGLLKLLDVSSPADAYAYLREAALSGRATKKMVRREVSSAVPLGSIWPSLYAADFAHKGTVVTEHVMLTQPEAKLPWLHFSGANMILDGVPTVCRLDYESPEPISTISSEALKDVGQCVLTTLNKVYGHACYRYDTAWPKPRTALREEVLGLDGKPNEHARFGYVFSHQTRPGAR